MSKQQLREVMGYVVGRAREPSTWRGIVWLLTALGLAISPEQAEAVAVAGTAVAGLIGVFAPDAPAESAAPARGA